MRHCAELSDTRCCAGRCVFSLWRREARPLSSPAALIKTLTSGVSDRSTASISNESGGDATRGRLPGSLPSGSRRDGAQGCFKIVISPSGQKEVDPLCTWRPDSIYCSQVSIPFSFISPFDCLHECRGSDFISVSRNLNLLFLHPCF